MSHWLYQGLTEPLVQPEVITADKWFSQFRDPVRVKLRLLEASQRFGFWNTDTPPPPIVDISWFMELEPPRVPARNLLPAWQMFFAIDMLPPPVDMDWFVDLSTPQIPRFKFSASNQQFFTSGYNPYVSFSWMENLSEPVRFRVLATAQNPAFSPPGYDPVVSFSWMENLSEPVRFRVLATAQNPSFFPSLNPFVPFSWMWPETQTPVRTKPGLGAYLQRAFTNDTELTALPTINLIQWYANLSLPVMEKIWLPTTHQKVLAAPERVLPTPNVFVTMAVTEVDTDSAEFGVVTFDNLPPYIAKVSIEEISVPGNAATSIREP